MIYFSEDENGKKKEGLPKDINQANAEVFVKFLESFYKDTLKFNTSLTVTFYMYFHKLYLIQSKLISFAKSEDLLLSSITVSMKKKYDKYWNIIANINNTLLLIVTIIDSRYKFDYVTFFYQ